MSSSSSDVPAPVAPDAKNGTLHVTVVSARGLTVDFGKRQDPVGTICVQEACIQERVDLDGELTVGLGC